MNKFLLISLVILFAGCQVIPTDFVKPNENSPETMFRGIIADPIPQSVANLKGASLYWQGYEVYFRFNSDDEFIDGLLKNHERVSFESIKIRLTRSPRLKDYLDFWTIDLVENPEYYKSKEPYKNKATHSGSDWIVIDRAKKVVYFYGIGA